MYNRYIRNDQGGYTRVPEPEQSGRRYPVKGVLRLSRMFQDGFPGKSSTRRELL